MAGHPGEWGLDADSGVIRSVRHLAGHRLTAVAPIDPKVRVCGQEDGIGPDLRHAHEAGIGESHRNIGVLLQKMKRTVKVVAQIEPRDDGVSSEELRKLVRAPVFQQVEGLGQDRLAGTPGRRKSIDDGGRPRMIEVAAVQECDEEAGVNENASGHTSSFGDSASFGR